MKPKALINLPQWVPVVWIAAVLSIFSFFLVIRGVEWSGYVSLPGTIVEVVLWTFIMVSLHKKGNIKPILIVFISLSWIVNIVAEIGDLLVEESVTLGLISFIVWAIALIIIIVNYSGVFRKFAIVDLACSGGILAVFIIYNALGMDLQSAHGHALKWLLYPLIFLAYYPYQVLVEALNEGEDNSEEENEPVQQEVKQEDSQTTSFSPSSFSSSDKDIKPFQWFTKCLHQYADFKGRARRKEFWMFVLFYQIFALSLSLLYGLGLYIIDWLDEEWIIYSAEPATTICARLYLILSALYSLFLIVPALAVVVRRLHDTGRSGWFVLVSLIPIVGWIWLLVQECKDGMPEANEYGENPKMLN